MSRPKKQRRVCFLPQYTEFHAEKGSDAIRITMTVEEYEAIRLIDYLGFTQEMCAAKMNISRGSVQQLYFDARRKMAQFLVDGLPLCISGGDYDLCHGLLRCEMDALGEPTGSPGAIGEAARILIPEPLDNSSDPDFAEAEVFRCYETRQGAIVAMRRLRLNTKNITHLLLSLQAEKINVIFSFRMGAGYRNALKEAGLLVFLGLSGQPEALVQNFLGNRLACHSIINCRHRSADKEAATVHAPCARFGGYCLLKNR